MKILDFRIFSKLFENPRFSSKITKLSEEPQKRDFVVRSSKGRHSKGFFPYFHVFKLTITPKVSASIRRASLMIKNFVFNFFSPISVYSQTTKEILHKNVFDCTGVIFFENSRKSWVSGKKSIPKSETHSAVWLRSQLVELGTGFRQKKRHPLR